MRNAILYALFGQRVEGNCCLRWSLRQSYLRCASGVHDLQPSIGSFCVHWLRTFTDLHWFVEQTHSSIALPGHCGTLANGTLPSSSSLSSLFLSSLQCSALQFGKLKARRLFLVASEASDCYFEYGGHFLRNFNRWGCQWSNWPSGFVSVPTVPIIPRFLSTIFLANHLSFLSCLSQSIFISLPGHYLRPLNRHYYQA